MPTSPQDPFPLDAVLPPALLDTVRPSLRANPFRRLSNRPEVALTPDVLCQSVHINRLQGPARLLLGSEADGYFMHSLESLGRDLSGWLELGIRRFYLQVVSELPMQAYAEKRDFLTRLVESVRRQVGRDIELTVDPQGLCMRDDLRWGVTSADGTVDPEATLALMAGAALQFAQAGMDIFITIGRVNHEVAVARAALAKADRSVRVMAFSTNSETPNAYFDETAFDVRKANTGQKLLVSNANEMIVRALVDIAEGADIVIQKPIEGLHVLATLRALLDGEVAPDRFVESSPHARALLHAHPYVAREIAGLPGVLARRGAPVELGAYEVSGTYAIHKGLIPQYGAQLAYAMLDELYRNALAAGGPRARVIIGRNVGWYLHQRRTLGV